MSRDEFLPTSQVAAVLGESSRSVVDRIHRGEFPKAVNKGSDKRGGARWLIPSRDLDRFIESRQVHRGPTLRLARSA